MVNRDDDAAFERVVNKPARAVGARTVDKLRAVAHESGASLWQAARVLATGGALASRARSALAGFLELVAKLDKETAAWPLDERVAAVIKNSGLLEHYRRDKSNHSGTRVENLDELISAARQFSYDQPEGEALANFLARAALESGDDQTGGGEVHLMTLHSAKGLEFPIVFLCGLEEGLFPHQRSLDDPRKLEEERRLCYVGMTRAMRVLCLTYAEMRRIHNADFHPEPSRFLQEIPAALVQEIRLRGSVTWQRYLPDHSDRAYPFALGQHVAHPKFGEGVVLNYEGRGAHARVQVNFEQAGTKWVVLAYANLEVV